MSIPQNISREKTLILGVDPGLSGALAFYCLREKKLIFVDDMPLRKVRAASSTKMEICTHTLLQTIKTFAAKTLGAVIEDVSAAPKQGVVSMFRFGYVTGLVAGQITAFEIPLLPTKPAVWKTLMGLSQNKNDSRDRAMKLFPEMKNQFGLNKDDGRAEAALLAYFGTRVFQLPPQPRSAPVTALTLASSLDPETDIFS
jgi:crossover junction endodeoxyribonuclease RuvC